MLRHASLSWIRLSSNPFISHLLQSLSQFHTTACDLNNSNSRRSSSARKVLSCASLFHTSKMKRIPLQRRACDETFSGRRERRKKHERLVPV